MKNLKTSLFKELKKDDFWADVQNEYESYFEQSKVRFPSAFPAATFAVVAFLNRNPEFDNEEFDDEPLLLKLTQQLIAKDKAINYLFYNFVMTNFYNFLMENDDDSSDFLEEILVNDTLNMSDKQRYRLVEMAWNRITDNY